MVRRNNGRPVLLVLSLCLVLSAVLLAAQRCQAYSWDEAFELYEETVQETGTDFDAARLALLSLAAAQEEFRAFETSASHRFNARVYRLMASGVPLEDASEMAMEELKLELAAILDSGSLALEALAAQDPEAVRAFFTGTAPIERMPPEVRSAVERLLLAAAESVLEPKYSLIVPDESEE